MPSKMIISKKDFAYNADLLKQHIKVPIIAVVKLNGYGIGLKNAVQAWYDSGTRFFAVSEPDEALELHGLGFNDINILLMSPVYENGLLNSLLQKDIILTVTSKECANAVSKTASKLNVLARVHVKIDVGMGRFGVKCEDRDEILSIYQTSGLLFMGIFSHFPYSFEKNFKNTKLQLENFKGLLSFLKENKIRYGMAHIANSCAAIRFQETWLDAVRIGSAVLGRMPVKTDLPLKKIGYIQVEIAEFKTLKKGESAGYSQKYRARKTMRVAVLEIGHQDGFGVIFQNDNYGISSLLRSIFRDIKLFFKPQCIYFKGSKLRVAGRIGNQYTLFDISKIEISTEDIIFADINTLLINHNINRVII